MNKLIKILIHTIFWLVYTSFSVQVSHESAKSFGITNLWPHLVINTLWAIVAFYSFYFFVIRYFEKHWYGWFLIVSTAVCISCTVLFMPIHFLFNQRFNKIYLVVGFSSAIGTFIIGLCGCLVRGFEKWLEDLKLKGELENRTLRIENELLKSQISPHFLFNTLNNIDSFIHTQPLKASEILISLSDMLRYMTYETNAETVPLSKEIEYIRNYVNLQKIRFKNPDTIQMTLPQNCGQFAVAPLLLLPFVENAFKHASSFNEKNAIKINISCTSNILVFNCINNYKSQEEINKEGGKGLENVKRRLELLYKNKHKLDILKNTNVFEVNLVLEI